jgi:hypothetical protein
LNAAAATIGHLKPSLFAIRTNAARLTRVFSASPSSGNKSDRNKYRCQKSDAQ